MSTKKTTKRANVAKPIVRRSAFVNIYRNDDDQRVVSVSDWDTYEEAFCHRERSDGTYIETVEIRRFA